MYHAGWGAWYPAKLHPCLHADMLTMRRVLGRDEDRGLQLHALIHHALPHIGSPPAPGLRPPNASIISLAIFKA